MEDDDLPEIVVAPDAVCDAVDFVLCASVAEWTNAGRAIPVEARRVACCECQEPLICSPEAPTHAPYICHACQAAKHDDGLLVTREAVAKQWARNAKAIKVH
jgi:hypothetical protein